MRKSIARFRDESYGLFIDLIPNGGHIGVDRLTGDILLDEGEGDDRFQGAAIDAQVFRRFDLIRDEEGLSQVMLHYGEGDEHGLGATDDPAAARRWIENANEVIGKVRSFLPPRSAPQRQEKVSIFSDAIRAVHPPVNYGKFERRPELDRLIKWARGSKKLCVISGSWGSGKSTLAMQFMLSACPGSIAGYREPQTPFGSAFYFSFYDDPRPETFLRKLTRWLKPGTSGSPKSAGAILTMLRRAHDSLIILDGFEAVQKPSNKRAHAELKLYDFLKRVGDGESGKVRVLVTTRDHRSLIDIARSEVVVLDRLPTDSAVSLLRSRGVEGNDKTLRKLASAVDYQPLALDMAGHCIREFGWQETWSELVAKQPSRAILDFRTIAHDFLFCLVRAAPSATGLLTRLCESSAQPRSTALPMSGPNDNETLLWCLSVLGRSSLMTSVTERDGYVGAASGGSTDYQFQPQVKLEHNARHEVLLQLLKLPDHVDSDESAPSAVSRRNKAPAWLRSVVLGRLKQLSQTISR